MSKTKYTKKQRALSNYIDAVQVVRMQDGTTTQIPKKIYGYQMVNGKQEPIISADFTGEPTCPRCGGCYDERGAISGNSGCLSARVYNSKLQYWHMCTFACSCIYGAWQYEVHRIAYADDRRGIPSGLTQDQLSMIDCVRWAGETYEEGAEHLPTEFNATNLQRVGFTKKFRPSNIQQIEQRMNQTKADINAALGSQIEDTGRCVRNGQRVLQVGIPE